MANDTWIWNGVTWTRRQPAVVPPARGYATLVDDPEVGRVVMFGGFGSGGLLNDTWSWDGANWRREQTATSPPARTGSQVAFDGTHLLLYGGYNGVDTIFGDTWSWNGSNWTQLMPATSPPARANGAMTYDPVHHEVVLFGGSKDAGNCPAACTGRGIETAETWTWNGTTWTQRQPAHIPPAVTGHSMIFDPDLGGVVLFNGGSAGAQGYDLIGTRGFYNNQLWLWDGTDWTQVLSPTVPGPRGNESLAYDAARHSLVLYGGGGVHGIQGDTWTFATPSVELLGVKSRKTHGQAGPFDVDLAMSGNPTVECRTGGENGDYEMVFVFANPLTSVTNVTIATGTGSIKSRGIGEDPHEYIVDLTGVANAQTLTLTLSNVDDVLGNHTNTLQGTMAVLLGDTTGDGFENSTDIAQTKSQSGSTLTNANFREDLTADGNINSTDIALAKSKSGTALSQ
jgi:hypothetical protein